MLPSETWSLFPSGLKLSVFTIILWSVWNFADVKASLWEMAQWFSALAVEHEDLNSDCSTRLPSWASCSDLGRQPWGRKSQDNPWVLPASSLVVETGAELQVQKELLPDTSGDQHVLTPVPWEGRRDRLISRSVWPVSGVKMVSTRLREKLSKK